MANRPSGDNPTDSYYLEKQENLLTELDPNLQKLILDAREQGREPGARTCNVYKDCGELTVDVIAKLHKRTDKVEGLIVGRRIGQIVTGTVALKDIESVRKRVLSLKAATPVRPALGVSVPEIGCDATALRNSFPGIDPALDGSGVIVGVVDQGCDFQHPNFRNANSTRLLFLWDQRAPVPADLFLAPTAPPPASHPYGREFNRAMLNQALSAPDPFLALGYRPESGAHGTHVLDVAAGNGRVPRPPEFPPASLDSRGVAPGADLIFVHVDIGDVPAPESLGNSRRLLEAVEYIFDKADKLGRPAVVNISLGTQGGPHDGSTPVEQGFERLLRKPGRALVIAAGNFFRMNGHTLQSVRSGKPMPLSWRIRSGDSTPNEMEIWYGGDTPLEVSLVFPGNAQRLGPVLRGETHVIRREGDNRMMGQIIHRETDPNNLAHQIDLLLDPDLPAGVWTVELSHRTGQPVEIHAWIERDDNGPSSFATQAVPSHTLASICCGKKPIAVGAYNSNSAGAQLMPLTSSGPTRDGRNKPDVSAPGQDVLAADALGSLKPGTGTSVAAPHVTGLVALLFQAAGPVSNGAIKRALRSSARRNPPAAAPRHHLRYGHGRVTGVAALQQLLASAQLEPEEEAAPDLQINLDGAPVPMVPADLDASVPAVLIP